MFVLAVFALGCMCAEQTFFQKASLLTPFVDNRGKSMNWVFSEDYVVKVQGSSSFLQLGYAHPQTSGAIVSASPIGSESFSIDLNIEIDEGMSGDGDGLAISLSREKDFVPGGCFGRSCNFSGLLIVISPSNAPYIGFKAGDVSFDARSPKKSLDHVVDGELSMNTPFILRIVQNNYQLSVYIGKSHERLSLVHTYKSNVVGKDHYLGLSASTGQTSNSFRLLGIESYHLKGTVQTRAKGESHRGGRLVWLIFFVVVGVTGYYLYLLQIKKKN